MGYEYDVFISYPFGDPDDPDCVGEWVRNLFQPLLSNRLRNLCGHEPRIFVDKSELKNGLPLDDQLRGHLGRSKVLVPVWTSLYFRRQYCMNEWYSMMARQQVCNPPPPQLIYPVVWMGDGQNFPPPARDIARFRNLEEFSCLSSIKPNEAEPRLLTRFKQEMVDIAKDLLGLLGTVPAWRDDWPVEVNVPIPELPRMLHPTGVV